MTKAATPCFTPRITSANLSTITIYTGSRHASFGSRYYGIMHVVAEAGSVRACQLRRREHAANIWPSLCWPSGCLVESKRQETHSKRLFFLARLEGQSAWARIYPIEIYIIKNENTLQL